MEKNIAIIAGDGIGPEIMAEALKALDCVQELYGHRFNIVPVCAGGCALFFPTSAAYRERSIFNSNVSFFRFRITDFSATLSSRKPP